MAYPKYTAFGMILIGGLAWMNVRGWGSTSVKEQKVVPQSIRQNPGSYRPVYGGYAGYGGGGGGSRSSGYPTGK